MHITQQSVVVLKHVQFYLNYVYKTQLALDDPACIKKFYQLVQNQDDWLLDSYWNDFVSVHNANARKKDKLPFKKRSDIHDITNAVSLVNYIQQRPDRLAKH